MDIVGISETNIKKNTPSELFTIEGYNLIKNNRDHKGRGGVGIYFKQHLKAKKINRLYRDK